MKMLRLKIQTQWMATWLSILTLILSPVAMGEEAKKISTAQVQSALVEMGLHRKITVGEFYQNTKALYPERIRKEIEPLLMNFKNTIMPEFAVTTVKANDGSDVANVRMTYNGQLLNFQFFGEKEKFVKFQNTNLSEIDIINFDDMFTRVLAGDETLRKQAEIKTSAGPKKQAGFEYPTVTKEIWKSMTVQDRANYMINLRSLWTDARRVMNETQPQNNKSNKKTSSLEKLDSIWGQLFESKVEAAEVAAKAASKKTKARSDKVLKTTPVVGDSTACLVAGYVTTYGARYCDHRNIKQDYLAIPDVKEANKRCGDTMLACNPIVFGTPGGNPICLDPKNLSFQIATHYDGPCETIKSSGNNHLGSEVSFLKDDKKQVGRYAPENITKTDIRAEVKKELNGNYAATQDFLNGLLKFRGEKEDLFTSGTISEETLSKIREIKNQFESDIQTATASCIASSNEKTHKDKNFWKACDQLQRRFIFVEEYLQQKCPQGSTINDKYKCACGPDKSTEVMPGEKVCKAGTPPVVPVDPAKPTDPTKPEPVKPDPSKCPPGQVEKVTRGDADTPSAGAEAVECVPDGKTPGKKSGAGGSGIWDFLKKLAPFAIGGIALYAMVKLMSPKKPALNGPKDVCPNGLTPPCGQVCPVPQAMQASGICGCAACPPGQAIADGISCQCSSTATPTTLKTCADGVTKVDDFSKCPSTTYPCWDGTRVSNPLNCPEKPAVTPGNVSH